jgi:hypothetical protein
MITTSLHEFLAFISEHLETDGESVVSHYHAWLEDLFEKELKVRVEIQHYGIPHALLFKRACGIPVGNKAPTQPTSIPTRI